MAACRSPIPPLGCLFSFFLSFSPTPLLKIPVWWRRAVLPSLPWVVCFLSFFSDWHYKGQPCLVLLKISLSQKAQQATAPYGPSNEDAHADGERKPQGMKVAGIGERLLQREIGRDRRKGGRHTFLSESGDPCVPCRGGGVPSSHIPHLGSWVVCFLSFLSFRPGPQSPVCRPLSSERFFCRRRQFSLRRPPHGGSRGAHHDRPDTALRTRKQGTGGIPELKTGYQGQI